MTLRKLMKVLHTVGSFGLAGGLAAIMVMLAFGPEPGVTREYVALRGTVESMSTWLVLPSMVLSLTSGLLAIAVHYPFMDAGWVWLKAILGLLVFEATLASVDGPIGTAATATQRAAAGEIDVATMLGYVDDKWVAWWVLMAIFVANVVLAIWRPRFMKPLSES